MYILGSLVRLQVIGSNALALLIMGLLFLGCSEQPAPTVAKTASGSITSKVTLANVTNKIGSGMQASPLDSTNFTRSFVARGIVRNLGADGKTVVVRHEDIPGFMPKMTMEFDVRVTNELAGLKPGDAITFNVKATEDESWIENIRPATTNDMAPLPPTESSASLLHVAKMKPGDVLPDTDLLAEDGRAIKLSDSKGQALAFTFIFTRCPLPDFCPRMNQHFNRARETLLRQTDGPTNWQFLSISFDPGFDKPEVLTRYAYSYRGQNTNRWLFASASSSVMDFMSSQLDFRFANEGGSFVHNLRTVVLDGQRRVYRQFDGNKWKAEDLAQAITEAAQSKN
jgi:protein SCO1